MTFADMQSLVLMRLRQKGVNFGGAAAGAVTDFSPPYELKLLLNLGYNEFLAKTKDYPIAAVKVSTPSIVSTANYSIRPIAANGGTINPAALTVYEVTYTPFGGQERYIPSISTARFRRYTGNYQRVLGNYGQYPRVVTQQFGRPQISFFPGTSVAGGDLINLTVCPDPANSPAGCSAANGGLLVNDADVPLFPSEFHKALVEYTVAEICDAANRPDQRDAARLQWSAYLTDAMEFGSSNMEGDAEQSVQDIWPTDSMMF